MLQNGVDVRTLQEVLGHDHLNTTQIYTHVDSDDLRLAARANPLNQVKKRKKSDEFAENELENTEDLSPAPLPDEPAEEPVQVQVPDVITVPVSSPAVQEKVAESVGKEGNTEEITDKSDVKE